MEDCSQMSDEQVVKCVLDDSDYFFELINRYEVKLFRYVRRITALTDQEIEDVLQEIFLKVYKNLRGFNGSLKFSSWIYRVTRNYVISNYRKNNSGPQIINFEGGEFILEHLSDEFDVKVEMDREFLKKKVHNILENMDEKYREVLILKYFEDKDYKEISDIIKKPMGTVATLINRAKKNFKEMMLKNNVTL